MLDRIATFSGPVQRQSLVGSMQARLDHLVREVSSGRKSDADAAAGAGGASLLYQLRMQSDRATALKTSVTLAAQRLETAQSALTGLADVAQPLLGTVRGWTSAMPQGLAVVAEQARGVLHHVVSLLNTGFAGRAVFGGNDATTPPMRMADAPDGILAVARGVLSDAAAAKGGPLTTEDLPALLHGPDGLSQVFDDTHQDPTRRYATAAYTGATEEQPTRVLIGARQTVQYDASANQPAFRDLIRGLSMLSLLDAPSSALDDTARRTLLDQAADVLGTAHNGLNLLRGGLGAVQARLDAAVDTQQAAAQATEAQILSYVQTDTYGNATKISLLQTQLQATYALTAQISQLSLVRYMPNLG
jgi:flagellar hook-associated protein 3 FlgL